MKIVEYRVILPTNVPQYQVANLYMVAQRTREDTGSGEGIEIIKNEPYEREVDGKTETGQYTHKIMHFKSRVPGAIRWAIPDSYLHIHEKSHNAYPHFHTQYFLPGMSDDFYLLCESQHIEYHKGEDVPDNVLGLTPDELKIRKVIYLDIVNGKPAPEKKEWSMKNFSCEEAGIPPLQTPDNIVDETKPPEWTKYYEGTMMCAVKIIKFKFKWFGIQSLVEKYALDTVFHNVFLDSHRAMFRWVAKWHNMTIQDIRELEDQVLAEQQSAHFDE